MVSKEVSSHTSTLHDSRSNILTSADPIPSPQPSTTSSPASQPQPNPSAASPEQQHHADPDEVDISNAEHYYAPQTTNRIPPADLNDAQLRQMMLGMDSSAANGSTPSAQNNPLAAMMASMGMPNPGEPGGPDPDDPMMKMLSQMMAGAGGAGGPGGAQNPFAAMAGGAGGAAPQHQQQPPPDTTTAAIWRVLHFLVAAGLGLYIALLTQFTGTKVARERSAFAAYSATGDAQEGGLGGGANAEDLRRYFFWAFATAESILLTSRFFLDKGARGPSGMVATVLGFVPESKWKSLVVNAMQYVQIFSTVRMDMLVCVFVLGVCSLVKG